MIRVRVREFRLYTNLSPAEVALATNLLQRLLNDRFDPKRLRARRKWQEVVDGLSGSERYLCNCRCEGPTEGGDYVVDVTGIEKRQGKRSGAKPTR